MQQKWAELLVVLNKMLSIYQVILTISQQKKQILVEANVQELAKVTKQEETLFLQIGKLEELRRTLINELMMVHGITGNASLEQLCKIAKPDIVEQLEVFSKQFGMLIAELVPLNKLNTELVKRTLGFINYNINILSQTVVGPTYAAKGQASEQSKRRMFDAKV